MTEGITEPIAHAAEEVPEPVVTDPPQEHHEPAHEEHHESAHDHLCPECIAHVVSGVVDAVKEASPVTPAQEEILDKSPVKPPWTHRSLFGHKE